MTSYIKFMFKYLFEPEALSAELLEEAGGGAGGNSSGLFILSPQQQPANYSASLLATDTSSSPASALGDNLLTSLPNSSSSSSQPGGGGSGGLVSLTIINKSSPLSAGNTDRALLAGHGQHHQHQQQQLEWLWLQQQQSAESDGNDAKLWPSKCLNFVRLFAMAQTNNNNNNSPNGTTSTVANGTSSGQLGQLSSSSSSTTSSSSSSSASAYSSSSWPANSLLVRLGSFTEFEHLIRQQLAGLFNGSSSNNNNNNNSHRILRSVATSSTTTPDSSSSSSSSLSSTAFSILNQASRPPQIRADPYQGPAGLTGAGPTTTTSSSGDSATWSSSSLVQDGHSTSTTTNNSGSGRLLRLLIRSIGASQEEEDRGTLLEVSVGPTAAQASGQSRQLREAQAMVSGEQHGSSSSSPATTTSPLPSASWLANWMPAQDPTPAGAESIQQQQQQQQQQWATETFASSPTASSAELLDCYKQLQLSEYYQGYDIFIGLRIASTLTILFVVFILFVIYKTGCRDGDRVSRSQLRLTSAAGNVKGGAGMASGPARQAANLRDKQQTRRPRRKGKTACRTSPGRNDCGKSGFACSCAHQASCSPSASEPHYPPGQKPWLLLARGDEQIIEATNGGGGCGAASVAGATLTLDQEPPDTGQNKNRPINKSWPTSNTGEPQHWPTAATTAKTTTTTSPSVVITAAHGEPL